MLEPAPGLLSTTIDWPRLRDSGSPITRETRSAAPPGAKPSTSLTGRVGQACASASAGSTASRSSKNGRISMEREDKPKKAALADARQALVRQREAVHYVARDRLHQLQLRAQAHLLHRLRLELGQQQVGHGVGGRVARRLAAVDVAHLAEEFAGVHHVDEAVLAHELD